MRIAQVLSADATIADTSKTPSFHVPHGVHGPPTRRAEPPVLSQSNPHLSPAILATPATSPPLPALELHVGGLPWMFNASLDAGLSPGNTNVTVQGVLLAIYYHLRTAVTSAEYEVLSKSRKAEIFRVFERRVGTDSS